MPGKTVTMRKKGRKPITFTPGSLHRATDTPPNENIPEDKKRKALAGGYGEAARKKANLGFRGALAKGRKTAARNRSRR